MRLDACVVGVGTSEQFGYDLGRSAIHLQFESFAAALRDAGLEKSSIDGTITAWGTPRGVDYDEFAIAAGLNLRWSSQLWTHGRWSATVVTQAALAVSAGLADYVAIINGQVSSRGYGRHLSKTGGPLPLAGVDEDLRDGGGPYAGWTVHGSSGAGAGAALAAQQYMHRYGATPDDLAKVVVGLRRHANLNPMAILHGEKLSEEQYLAEPELFGPLRWSDFCVMVDHSTCLIVTTAERAADLDKPAVRITGAQGIPTSRDDYAFLSRPGLGTGISAAHPYTAPETFPVYSMAGVERGDVDAFFTYDPFSPMVWMALERWGFCQEGDAPAYVRDVGFAPESPLPINTHGGSLGEGHLYAYGHMIEMVRQLRGEAGPRQITDPKVLQWGTTWGDSLIFTNE